MLFCVVLLEIFFYLVSDWPNIWAGAAMSWWVDRSSSFITHSI